MTLACLIVCIFMTCKTQAAKTSTVDYYISSSDGASTANSVDGDYTTINTFEAGNNIVFISEKEIYGVYLEWGTAPGKFEVSYNNISETYGENGFLHEFIDIQSGAKEIKLTFNNGVELANAYAYGNEELPEDVQTWKKCDGADVLIIATHIGDELLFFGGVISNFVDKDLEVQVAHFFDYTESDNLAEHEKLDALWKMGVKNYPVTGIFEDADYDSMELCEKVFDREMGEDWIANVIMTYKPVVCVTHAFNGEYFNNTHKYVADMVKNSVENLSNNGQYEVQKTYFHIYEEN